MRAWLEAGKPAAPHKEVLTRFVGEWTVSVESFDDMRSEDEAEPVRTTATASAEAILGGRFIHLRYRGNWSGVDFEGTAVFGYDNARRCYTSVWIDALNTGTEVGKGTFDAATSTLTFEGTNEEARPDGTAEAMGFRWVFRFLPDGSITSESYGIDEDGEEFLEERSTFRRKGK